MLEPRGAMKSSPGQPLPRTLQGSGPEAAGDRLAASRGFGAPAPLCVVVVLSLIDSRLLPGCNRMASSASQPQDALPRDLLLLLFRELVSPSPQSPDHANANSPSLCAVLQDPRDLVGTAALVCRAWGTVALSRQAWEHRMTDTTCSRLPLADLRRTHPWPQLWAVQRPGNLLQDLSAQCLSREQGIVPQRRGAAALLRAFRQIVRGARSACVSRLGPYPCMLAPQVVQHASAMLSAGCQDRDSCCTGRAHWAG